MVNFPVMCFHIHREAFGIKMLTATDDRIHIMVSKVIKLLLTDFLTHYAKALYFET